MSALRPIETKGYAKLAIPATFGLPPKLEWLPIAALVVDPEYQREISNVGRKNIRHIAENFCWSMFSPVMVSAIGGGKYAIVDGQHRSTAAALCGIEKVPCYVVEAPRGEQAKAFRAINANTTRPHKVQLFHAAVAANETTALQVLDVCKAAGVRIARSLQSCRDYETFCVGSIEKGIERHGAKVVTLALKAIVHSGDGVAEELNQTIITSTVEVLARSPIWCRNEAALKSAFEAFNLGDMWRNAATEASRSKGASTRQVLERELTKGLQQQLGVAA
ncbi:DUF6551 family protein [Bradyrhizobium sp. PMVTL-01]|uniref:DUF6551 family protein n=1 Tax=Bradyrhizobium sp. PMVTL-01 TaxID=3434999 RepID=UPI003F70EE3C